MCTPDLSRRFDRPFCRVSRVVRSAGAAAATLLVAVTMTVPLTGGALGAATYDGPVEDYAPYQPQRKCRDTARPGARELAAWINERYDGGAAVASVRACSSGGVSEHKAGRAVDWAMDATRKKQRREVRRFLDRIFATDRNDENHALARRMGVMYVVWNDHMYASYDEFAKEDYLSATCSSRKRCSVSQRHRDHVHISLSRSGGRGDTTWYQARD